MADLMNDLEDDESKPWKKKETVPIPQSAPQDTANNSMERFNTVVVQRKGAVDGQLTEG